MQKLSTSQIRGILSTLNSPICFALLSLLLFINILPAEPSDTLWTKTVGGNEDDVARCIKQTIDGGYILTGYTESMGAGDWDLWLVKTDYYGDTLWTRTYGGVEEDLGYYVQQTKDDGYIVTGYTESFSAAGKDLWLLRTNSLGDTIWTKTYGDAVYDDIGRYVEQIGGGYCVAGYTSSLGSGADDMWLIITNPNGDSLWTMTYGGSANDHCYSAQQTMDGGYNLVGATSSYGAGEYDFYMVKVDRHGITEWQNWYGQSQAERYFCVHQTSDRGYLATGYSWSFGTYGRDLFLVKKDESGNTLWDDFFAVGNQDVGWSVIETRDRNVLVGGWTGDYYYVNTDMFVVQTDSVGNLLWQETYGGGNNEYCYSLIQNYDGNYVLAGFTESYGAGGKDIWIVCLEGDPYGGLSLDLEPLNPPIILPPEGGGFSFECIITNDSSCAVTFDGWYNIIDPLNQTYGPIILKQGLIIQEDQSRIIELYCHLDESALSGTYLLEGFAGDFPDSVYATDSFTFEKLASDNALSGTGWICFIEGETLEKYEISMIDHQSMQNLSLTTSPNPFNQRTTISFKLSAKSFVNLIIYDVTGRQVVKLADEYKNAGTHEVVFDASDLASGVYFVKLEAGEFRGVGKMLLVK